MLSSQTPEIMKNRFGKLIPEKKDLLPLYIGAGSEIRSTNGKTNLGGTNYSFDKEDMIKPGISLEEVIEESIVNFIHTPYIWGGKSSFGIDCSGLVQNIFKQAGIGLPRDASKQSMIGKTLSFVSESKTGDLAFFDNEEGDITHVGIITGKERDRKSTRLNSSHYS